MRYFKYLKNTCIAWRLSITQTIWWCSTFFTKSQSNYAFLTRAIKIIDALGALSSLAIWCTLWAYLGCRFTNTNFVYRTSISFFWSSCLTILVLYALIAIKILPTFWFQTSKLIPTVIIGSANYTIKPINTEVRNWIRIASSG